MRNLRMEKRADGVAMITFDTPDSKVNIISRELFGEIAAILDEIEKDDAIRAGVLVSGKPGSFIAGADLEQLRALRLGWRVRIVEASAEAVCVDVPADVPVVAALLAAQAETIGRGGPR